MEKLKKQSIIAMMKQKSGMRRFEEVGEGQYSFVSHSKKSGLILKSGREITAGL